MCTRNQQLGTDEPVEFEELPGEVGDCRKITEHCRGIFRVYLKLIKEEWRMSTFNQLDLQTLGSQLISMPKNLPGH